MFQKDRQLKHVRFAAVVISGMFITGMAFATKAAAQTYDRKTYVTFNQPVEVPGKVLSPGTYVFKLLNSASDRDIVTIWDQNEQHLEATILGVPDYRLKPADRPVIRFEERPSGEPEALKAWFYPGDNYGIEFVYPHERAVQLAKRTKQNVLSMNNAMSKNMSDATASAKPSAGDPGVQELQHTGVSGVDSNGRTVALTVVISTRAGN